MKKTFLIIALLTIYVLTYNKVYAQSGSMKANPTTDSVLAINRKKIDALDKKLIEIIGERERVVKEIGIYKAKNNIAPLQAARFDQVLEKGVEAGKKEGLSEEFITELLNAIHKESLRIEDEIKAGKTN
jgi:chorismate mutase